MYLTGIGGDVSLGDNIRENRERLGLSQEDVSHAIYVTRQTVSNWENDKTYPDVHSLLLLSNLFKASIDDLVRNDPALAQEAGQDFTWQRKVMKFGPLAGIILCLVMALMFSVIVPMLSNYVARNGLTYPPIVDIAALMGFVAGVGGFVLLCYVSSVSHSLDLDTRGEIAAFLQGADPDQVERVRESASRRIEVPHALLGGLVAVILTTLFWFYVFNRIVGLFPLG